MKNGACLTWARERFFIDNSAYSASFAVKI